MTLVGKDPREAATSPSTRPHDDDRPAKDYTCERCASYAGGRAIGVLPICWVSPAGEVREGVAYCNCEKGYWLLKRDERKRRRGPGSYYDLPGEMALQDSIATAHDIKMFHWRRRERLEKELGHDWYDVDKLEWHRIEPVPVPRITGAKCVGPIAARIIAKTIPADEKGVCDESYEPLF